MHPLGKPHVFPFVQAVSAAFLAAGGAAFILPKTSTTIMLMASGSTEVIGENYNIFDGLRLSPKPDNTYGGNEVRIKLSGVDGWDATSTSDLPDGTRWCSHNLKMRVSITSMSDVVTVVGVQWTRFVVCAMSIAEDIQRVIDDYSANISYQTMTVQEVLDAAATAKAERDNYALRTEISDAVQHIRRGMRVGGKSVVIPRVLMPEAMKVPGTYPISFDDYGGKVTKRYEVIIPAKLSKEPYVKRVL